MKKFWLLLIVMIMALGIFTVASATNNGWAKEGKHICYYRDGVKVTGTQTINNDIFYFTNDGWIKGNGKVQYVNYGYYYINDSNEIVTGWQTVDGYKYYFFPDEGYAAVYSYGESGPAVEIDGAKYVFDSNGHFKTNGWCYEAYADKDGHPLTGFQTIDGKNYLFSETGKVQSGFHEKDGKYIYFYSNWSYECYQAFGWALINKSLHYFDPISGYMQTADRMIDGTNYQFNNDGTLRHNSSVVIKYENGSWYGYNASNESLSDWQTINGSIYWFDYDGRAAIGIRSISNEYYYFNSEGKMQYGWQKHKDDWDSSEHWFYYGSDGKRLNGFQKIDGNTYYFNYNYGMVTGSYEVYDDNHGYNYFFFDSDGRMQTGLIEHDGKKFFYGSDGKRLSGWQQVGDDWYYFDVSAVIGSVGIDSEYYYFNSEGKMQTGWQKYKRYNWDEEPELWYYHGTDGKRLNGFQKINGNTYYLNDEYGRVTGVWSFWNEEDQCSDYYYFDAEGKMQTGWQKTDVISGNENWYYFGSDGKALFGWQTIDGETYYISQSEGMYKDGIYNLEKDGKYAHYQFDADGKLIAKRESIYTTGWYEKESGVWLYGDKDGFAVTGRQTIDGYLYYFNDEGIMQSGWIQDGGKWYYSNSSGALYNYGWANIGGTWYYFRGNGEMATGWVYDGGAYYYMYSDGSMAIGWIEDKGDWYFISKSGTMYTGWMKDGNSWYLLRPSGVMATGWIVDGGTWYYFLGSGAMATGWQVIDGQWEMFSDNGAWLYSWDGN